MLYLLITCWSFSSTTILINHWQCIIVFMTCPQNNQQCIYQNSWNHWWVKTSSWTPACWTIVGWVSSLPTIGSGKTYKEWDNLFHHQHQQDNHDHCNASITILTLTPLSLASFRALALELLRRWPRRAAPTSTPRRRTPLMTTMMMMTIKMITLIMMMIELPTSTPRRRSPLMIALLYLMHKELWKWMTHNRME